MRKFILLLATTLLISSQTFAQLSDVGIAKYAVLEVLDNNIPLILKDSEYSTRLTHLFKNAVLFADKQNDNYFRVE